MKDILKICAEYGGDGAWKLTMEKAKAGHEGTYYCTATNCFGSDTKRWRVALTRDVNLSADVLDDIKIYHDNTIVSGDVSDPEFIEEMVLKWL